MRLGTESVLSNIQKKLKEMGAASTTMNTTLTKLKDMGAVSMMNTTLKDMEAESMMNTTLSKLKDMGAKSMMNTTLMMKYLLEKLKESLPMLQYFGAPSLLVLENFGGKFIEWTIKVLSHRIQVSAPFIILGLGLVLLVLIKFPSFFFRCCSICCRGVGFFFRVCYCICCRGINFFFSCCCICCGGTGRAAPKMMKAPGINIWIPRMLFEANPAAYFRVLRALNRGCLSPKYPAFAFLLRFI